jgi:anhydro-N-acetylmuramic acid kinase
MHQKKVFFRVIGIMSGTSLDGIDLALIKFNIKTWDFKILKSKLIPYNKYWISELSDIHFKSKNELLKIDLLYTKFLGEKINEFITENKLQNIDMVCSHGHTAIHNPDMGITYQLGNLSTLNNKYRIMTVCDFRIQDVALGGQGAPLVPVGDSFFQLLSVFESWRIR